MRRIPDAIRRQLGLVFGLATMAAFIPFGEQWVGHIHGAGHVAFFLVWLVVAILCSAFSVVRHADALAHRLGEPYGTLILTLSVTGMEVTMVTAIMVNGSEDPTLARDTMFAVVMIVLGGLVGAALLIGGFRHRLQEFNLDGANSFLSLIVPLSLLGLVMPNFTSATNGPTFSPFQAVVIAGVCVCAYAIFLVIQTLRHREFFEHRDAPHHPRVERGGKLWIHVVLLIVSLVPVVFLAEQLADVLDYAVHGLNLPTGLAGMIVASLILAPEGMGGVTAAAQNHLQRAVNLLLGSALATIALTIPAVLVFSVLTHHEVILGLSPGDSVLLAVVLAVSLMTFSRGRTNVLQGAIHILVFLVWIALLFQS